MTWQFSICSCWSILGYHSSLLCNSFESLWHQLALALPEPVINLELPFPNWLQPASTASCRKQAEAIPISTQEFTLSLLFLPLMITFSLTQSSYAGNRFDSISFTLRKACVLGLLTVPYCWSNLLSWGGIHQGPQCQRIGSLARVKQTFLCLKAASPWARVPLYLSRCCFIAQKFPSSSKLPQLWVGSLILWVLHQVHHVYFLFEPYPSLLVWLLSRYLLCVFPVQFALWQ